MITEAYLQGYMDKEAFGWDDVKNFYNKHQVASNAVAGGIGVGALAKLLGASNVNSGLSGLGGAALAGGGTYGYKNKDAIYAYLSNLFGGDKKDKVENPMDKLLAPITPLGRPLDVEKIKNYGHSGGPTIENAKISANLRNQADTAALSKLIEEYTNIYPEYSLKLGI